MRDGGVGRPLTAALALLLGLASACGPGGLVQGAGEPPVATGEAADVRASDLELGVALASVRAQHLVTLELFRRNEYSAALLHAITAGRLMQRVREALGPDASPALSSLDQQVTAAIEALEEPEYPEDLSTVLAEAGRRALAVEADVLGATASLGAYKASVTSRLLEKSATAYRKVGPRDELDIQAYRNGYAWLRAGAEINEGLHSLLEEQTEASAQEGEALFAVMFEAMPSSQLPEKLPPPNDVWAAAHLLAHLLQETHNAVPAPKPPPARAVGAIPPLLEEAGSLFATGRAPAGAAMVTDLRAAALEPAAPALEREAPSLLEALEAGFDRVAEDMAAGRPFDEVDAGLEDLSALAEGAVAGLRAG